MFGLSSCNRYRSFTFIRRTFIYIIRAHMIGENLAISPIKTCYYDGIGKILIKAATMINENVIITELSDPHLVREENRHTMLPS